MVQHDRDVRFAPEADLGGSIESPHRRQQEVPSLPSTGRCSASFIARPAVEVAANFVPNISEPAVQVSFMQLPTLVPRYLSETKRGAIMRTLGKIAATLAVVGAIAASSIVPAAAWYGYHHRHYHHNYGYHHRYYHHRYYAYYPRHHHRYHGWYRY